MVERPKPTGRFVALLDADPDLAAGLEEPERPAARRQAVAALLDVDGPGWDPSQIEQPPDGGWLGLFVVHGLLIRRVTVGRRPACELFGPGDLIRPWDTDGEYEPLSIAVDWIVRRPARLAILDTAFTLRVARWPSVISKLVGRVAQRARYLALIQAVTHLPRTYARLLIVFWLLAERWGKVGPDGVRIRLPLTHELLGMLVGAHRPTITIALQRLTAAGLLIRERSDLWLLTSRAMQSLRQPESLELIDEAPAER